MATWVASVTDQAARDGRQTARSTRRRNAHDCARHRNIQSPVSKQGRRYCKEEGIKTLVTGATGLLGSYIVEGLLGRSYQVRALVRETSDTSHLRTTSAELAFGDVERPDTLPSAVEGTDIVFHAAGRVTPGWGKWEEFENTIVKGTGNLLEASVAAGVSRFLYVSSYSVYGTTGYRGTPVDECAACLVECTPDTYYDYAKLKAEDLVFDYYHRGLINASVIRPSLIYGPRDRLNTDRVYRHMQRRIVIWPGKPTAPCAPVFASDVAEMAILAATSDVAIGQAYNVAPTEPVSFQDYCNAMIRAQGGRRIQIVVPYWLGWVGCAVIEGWARLRRAKEMPYLTRSGIRFLRDGQYVDGSKARRELGWEQKVSVDEGTRLYVEWRRSQADS